MAQSLYITAMEPRSGKSVVALGVLELLARRVERLGFFRPIVRSRELPDEQIELVHRRYKLRTPAERMFALTVDEAAAIDDYDELRKRIVAVYKELEQDCEFVVCEGTDFAGSAPALDFGLNADIANELGAPVLVVVGGNVPAQAVAATRAARAALEHKRCSVFGVLVNRVAAEHLAAVEGALAVESDADRVYVLPELPELARVTMADIAAELGARTVIAHPEMMLREVAGVSIADMNIEHFLDHLVEGALVIAPADRADILVACLASAVVPAIPAVAGVLLTGGYAVPSAVGRLLDSAPFPVLEVAEPTHVAAQAVERVRPSLRADDEPRIATALGLFEDRLNVDELDRRLVSPRPKRTTPIMFEYELIERAKTDRRHIVLPEGDDDRVLRAAEILLRRGVVGVTILGVSGEVAIRAARLGVSLDGADLTDPLTSPRRAEFASLYFEQRRHKGVTEDYAYDRVGDATYFATMMVQTDAADGMVSGAAHTTADTIRPAFEIIRAREGVSVVSSVFLMCLADRVLVYGDCAVNPKPSPDQLADIAISSAETASDFRIEPRIAMLSYSTGTSGAGEDVDRVREATDIARSRRPDLKIEGPIQYDAAVDASVAELKLPGSEVAGRASVFIFPDLESGNVAYKAVQRSADAVAIGPVLQGLRKPINDLSRGCTVTDIVNTVAITAIQAQPR
jgi:phosphate acetyltransferase